MKNEIKLKVVQNLNVAFAINDSDIDNVSNQNNYIEIDNHKLNMFV